jgi:hypothetical protein
MGRTKPLLISSLALGALTAAGCQEDPIFSRLPEPEVQVDELKQKPAALVDILWVVDNSESMVQEQQALAANFDRFISGLTVCQGTGVADDFCDFNTKKCSVSQGPCNPPDYHIGVIATDVRSDLDTGKLRRVGTCVPSAGASPSGGKHRYCQGDNRHCAHDANDPSSDPANSVCDMGQSLSFVTATTANAPDAFSRAVQVGIAGSGRETGIEAAAIAVGRQTNRATGEWLPAPNENAGFLRPDASLFLIFVSDEDDSSFGEVTYFYRAFETLRGAGNEGVVSISSIVGDPDLDGPDQQASLGGCPAGSEVRSAAAGTRYVALSMYSRGLSPEFRVCDDKRLKCPTGDTCKAPVPGLPGVCVPDTACQIDQDCGNFKCDNNRGCITCSNAKCELPANNFLKLLEDNGVFGSICNPDYGNVLGALGFEAAGLARKFALTKGPDCQKTVKCCAADVAEADCTVEAPVCVRVNGAVIANERAAGWVYESGSNAIFFDGGFVPPTDATISVSYRASSTGSAISCEAQLQ